MQYLATSAWVKDSATVVRRIILHYFLDQLVVHTEFHSKEHGYSQEWGHYFRPTDMVEAQERFKEKCDGMESHSYATVEELKTQGIIE